MTIDHDPTPIPLFQGPAKFENHIDRLQRHLGEADDLADKCSDLISGMRDYPPLSPVTERLVEAHALLVTAANTLAALR